MIDYEYRITGYHCNFRNKIERFRSNNEIYISIDTCYLGNGMYFWDNHYDLEYWEIAKKAEAKRKAIEEPIMCISARIEYNSDEIIDLTIKEEFEKLIQIKNIVNNAHKKGNSKFENCALGEVINKLFKSTDTLVSTYISKIKVMKANLRYENIKDGYIMKELDYYSSKLSSNQNLAFDIRTIYCVKDGANILFHEVLREEVAS